jgi:hypothetical protein
MKNLLLILALCYASVAQTTSPITVTVKTGTIQKLWQFILGSPTTITTFACTQPTDAQQSNAGTTVLMPGDSSTCTVTIAQGAGVLSTATQVAVSAPDPLTISADPKAPPGVTLNGGILSIPWGSTVGSFLVTYPTAPPASPVVAMQFWPTSYSTWTSGNTPQYYAELAIPCCARADLCGLTVDQVDQSACQ